MNGAHTENALKPQPREILRVKFHLSRIGLIADQKHSFLRLAQSLCHLFIQCRNARLDIHDEENHVGFRDRQIRLHDGALGNNVSTFFSLEQRNSTRIDQGVRYPSPLHLCADTVASHTGLVMHDSDSATGKSIEESGFSHIRLSHDGYNSGHNYT
ncbi:hypothetical protein SDC9_178164 [bioreactor metagenome]|uniref:Uncharacterized protein n=1 Tax=bioreactor metagenome TaxID=1076179 RepID=A0A645H4E1_9ZZZZ